MEKKILSRLYKATEGRKTTKAYNKLRKKLEEQKKRFLENIGQENQADLEHLTDIIYDMDNVLRKEDFCNGFSTAIKLIIESIYEENEGDDQE